MMDPIRVTPALTRVELRAFIDLPFRLYGDDPNWVAPLRSDIRNRLDPNQNPFFAHAKACLFLARRGSEVVGRISAHVDRRYNEFHSVDGKKDRTGFWGFFESVEDADVAGALFDAAASWAGSQGMTSLIGPASFSLNDEAGLLVDGFDSPPMILMTYNHPYYELLIEKAGLDPVQDLFAYRLDASIEPPAEIVSEARTADAEFTFRTIRLSEFDAEMQRFLTVYNDAWDRNWGFVPLTEEELIHHSKALRPILDPDLVVIAERGDEPVAIALSLPDVNEVLRGARGKLGPVSAARLLVKARRRRWTACRVFTLGVRRSFRRTGIGAHLYLDTLAAAKRNGYEWGEMSWILASNEEMNRAIRRMGGARYKTYRMFRLGI
jgi:GNAT superfamily N-acetyltransferase